MTPAEQWDALIRRAASTTGSSPPSGRTRLRLTAEPRRRWLPDKPRSLAEIPAALRAAIRQAVAGETPWPLVVLGPAGVGKTCAALCLLDHAGGFYYTARDLAAEFARSMQGRLLTPGGRVVWPEQLWDELAGAALVVLDELGSVSRVSDHQYECVKKLLDLREGKPLVVLSNLSTSALSACYDERVVSRLAAGTGLALEGEDRRLASRAARQKE